MTVSIDQIQRIAGFEINGLRAAGIIGDVFEKVRIPAIGTPIHDINGAILFYRMPLRRAHPGAGGVITRWVNFATQIYRYAFTAVLNHV